MLNDPLEDTLASTLSRMLISLSCTSNEGIYSDDAVVLSLFSPSSRINPDVTHIPQILGLDFSGKSDLLSTMYRVFEDKKQELVIEQPKGYLEVIRSMKITLIKESHDFKRLPQGMQSTIEWCLAAYSVIIHPSSLVRLKTVPMDANSTRGFAIHARVDIQVGTWLWELMGMMPKDNKTPHSELSSTTTNFENDQEEGLERVLFGPLRMVNHRCRTFNIGYMTVTASSAMIAWVLRDVKAGEELTVSYGDEWFGDACPCADCGNQSNQTGGNLRTSRLVLALMQARAQTLKDAHRTAVQERVRQESQSRAAAAKQNKKARNQRRRKLKGSKAVGETA